MIKIGSSLSYSKNKNVSVFWDTSVLCNAAEMTYQNSLYLAEYMQMLQNTVSLLTQEMAQVTYMHQKKMITCGNLNIRKIFASILTFVGYRCLKCSEAVSYIMVK